MKHKDGSFRLKEWNYSNVGLYFITICTINKEYLFGKIENGKMFLNEIGTVAETNWQDIDKQFRNIKIADFVIMPNHLHGILIIDGLYSGDTNNGNEHAIDDNVCPIDDNVRAIDVNVRAINRAPTKTGGITGSNNPMLYQNISTAVRWFKGKTTFDCRKVNPKFCWQPRFYDHVIRNQQSFIKIQDYIANNPKMWERDRNNDSGLNM
jgi:putative transposase